MALPKETTTGEVICDTCGWLHPEGTGCLTMKTTVEVGTNTITHKTTYGNLLSNDRS